MRKILLENIGTNIMLAWRGLIPGEVGQALETPPKSPALGRVGKKQILRFWENIQRLSTTLVSTDHIEQFYRFYNDFFFKYEW